MRYNSRAEVEAAGRAGSFYIRDEHGVRARMLNSFWLYLDEQDEGFYPHQTTSGEGFWESWITTWTSQNVAPGSRCLDIGANIGYYTMFLLDHGCKVVAIEPQDRLATILEKSVAFNGFELEWGHAERVAISDKDGVVDMFIPDNHGMNAWLSDLGYAEMPGVTINVPSYTLDAYCQGKDYWDFVKIDAEGVEETLFRGAKLFMEENPNCVYLVEWGGGRLADVDTACNELFLTFNVGYVDFHGTEIPIASGQELLEMSRGDWLMLVLRKK